jgi:hypothetical protein
MSDSIPAMELNERKVDDTTINAILQSFAYGLKATYHSSLPVSPDQLILRRDMIINAVYLANRKDFQTRCRPQIRKNNAHENKCRIPHNYVIGDSVYIRKSNIEQNLNPLQGQFIIQKFHTNSTITIRCSPTISERINIRRLQAASTCYGKRVPYGQYSH